MGLAWRRRCSVLLALPCALVALAAPGSAATAIAAAPAVAAASPAPSAAPPDDAPAIGITVEGTLTDRYGQPLAGRRVELRDDTSTLAGAATDAGGAYRLEARTPPGERFLVVLEGARVVSEERLVLTALLDGATLHRDLRLRPAVRGVGASAALPYTQVRVFYATDRAPTTDADPRHRYSSARSATDALALGSAVVTIPKDHRLGELETPSIWKLELTEDPARHVVLASVTPEAPGAFYAALHDRVGRSARHEALVYVHGFLTSWEDALRVTAQLTYDLQFDGAAIAYTWPSGGSLAAYSEAENNAEWSTPHLLAFLRDLRQRTGATSVHLVAHSMGNRLVTRALQRLAEDEPAQQPLFNQVVLAAPDVDAGVFRQLAGEVAKAGRHVTLYASSNDEALKASMKIHAYPRAGLSGPDTVVVPGIDTVDVSAVDTSLLGHCYYDEATSVIADLYRLLRSWSPAAQRPRLQALGEGPRRFWRMLRSGS